MEGQHKNNANKNWINKIIGGETENILSYRCRCLLVPPLLAPPPFPLIPELFGSSVPILQLAERPIQYKKRKKKSSKCRENTQDGAIVHLMEDGAVTQKVPDDHVTAHVHTLGFRTEQTYFLKKKKISDRGIILHGVFLIITSSTVH